MDTSLPETGKELRTLVKDDATLELSLADVPVEAPKDNEVLIRVEAAPLNPSDLALLTAGADMSQAVVTGSADSPVVTVPVPAAAMRSLAGRLGESLPAGNEGAGTVVAAGSSAAAQSLIGRTVAIAGGRMYAQYRCADAGMALVLPEGTPARVGASSFVNPLTALGMVETMRREGHTALVHTAAASNLGQMLVKVCLEDGVPLVNIVRKPEQAELLRSIGAEHVLDSTAPGFMKALIAAVGQTGATLAFDAIGGGTLASTILTAMEAASSAGARIQPLRFRHPQAALHLWGTGSQPDRLEPQLRLCLGSGRVALDPVPRKGRAGDVSGAAATGRRRIGDDLRQLLHRRGVACGSAAATGVSGVHEAGDRREVPHRTAQAVAPIWRSASLLGWHPTLTPLQSSTPT